MKPLQLQLRLQLFQLQLCHALFMVGIEENKPLLVVLLGFLVLVVSVTAVGSFITELHRHVRSLRNEIVSLHYQLLIC